ncbi:uncharacterized protein VTP21DRAFT_6492 [Calcarisporiella thermophila]|uniref:uncharacterized protein n=1 Tax=Calcarisporiella thermophila TaxID=911321 RepID=UPI003742CED9
MEFSDLRRLPKLIVFDLDFTLWPLWIDTHISGPPFKIDSKRTACVTSCENEPVQLYKDVPAILHAIKNMKDVKIGIASRTHEPLWAKQILEIMPIPNGENSFCTLQSMIDQAEIYPGTKLKHFSRFHDRLKIDYKDMLFFDDEKRNIDEVGQKLGVHSVLVKGELTYGDFQQALQEFSAHTKDITAIHSHIASRLI